MNTKRLALLITTAVSINCYSFTEIIDTSVFSVNKSDVKISQQTFDSLSAKNFIMSKDIGQPSLPTQSYLFAAEPKNIQLNIEFNQPDQMDGVRLAPATPEKCRCSDDVISSHRQFTFSEETYSAPQALVTKTYLGKFRGTPVTKVDVRLVQYDAVHAHLTVYDHVKISSAASQFSFSKISEKDDAKNFLVVVPQGWEESIADFVAYKSSLGFNMIVESVSSEPLSVVDLENLDS